MYEILIKLCHLTYGCIHVFIYSKYSKFRYEIDFILVVENVLNEQYQLKICLFIMAQNLKFFQSAQKYFNQMGIYPVEPPREFSFNFISFCILISMILHFIPSTAYFFAKAQTIDEYSDTFYTSSTMFSFIFCFLINVWKMGSLTKLITRYEKYISESKRLNC